jgi:hypothetical protein
MPAVATQQHDQSDQDCFSILKDPLKKKESTLKMSVLDRVVTFFSKDTIRSTHEFSV